MAADTNGSFSRIVGRCRKGVFSLLSSLEGVASLVKAEGIFGIGKVLFGFPSVFSRGVTFPFYKKSVSSSLSPVGKNCLDFVLVLAFDKVRRWLREVLAVNSICLVG